MSLIPFILDLAEELHDFNRSMSMEVDEGFGVYPLDASPASHMHPHISRRGGAVGGISGGAMMWVPIKGQQQHQQQQPQHQASTQRHHPYRVAGAKTICCNRSLLDLEKELAEKSGSTGMNVGTGTGSGVGIGMQPKPTNSAYSVLNRNGFQVSMNVKQFTARELTVKTINDCIVVEGQHDEKEDGHGVISRHFIRKYMLPRGYDPAEVHSTLSTDGILTVKAPPPPPPVPRPGVERLERMVDIQQISHQQQQRDAQQQQPVQMSAAGAASAPAPTPTPSLSVSLAESNGNGPEETETETESAEATAAPSPSLSSEAAAAVAAVESTSNSSTDSTGNNGVDEPESMEVAEKKEEEEAAKEEPVPTPTPTPAAVVSSSGAEEPTKSEDANANDVAVASNNGNGAATVPDAVEDVEMPPVAPGDNEKSDKEEKSSGKVALVGGEELAAVDAAILQAKNQGENGATATKVEELAK
ncbi:heat shock protein 67B1 [Drosophila kikkawai]|uniref:Heat shock protein 67B1 n=1 Tax=Drosophila kikkawai TaxID=30033 RepID=A0A6P4IIQ2_DROKI|nr:heat shock protein 67B1 [Drosophila kikkawai]